MKPPFPFLVVPWYSTDKPANRPFSTETMAPKKMPAVAEQVQAELQDYLNVKGINALFVAIVEGLLIEKPTNPIAFM